MLLERLREGDEEAGALLFEQLYPELHRIARSIFRSQRRDHTLQPTVLVHEAYMKMVGGEGAPAWENRAHFCNVAARAMRQILVNHARDKAAAKRGGPDARRVTLHEADATDENAVMDVLALDEALQALANESERQARIAELRLFGGLSAGDIAEVLDLSRRTVELDWKMAKAFLTQALDV
jgi:RNA polymerase sigma factor (TIGR02999 family)